MKDNLQLKKEHILLILIFLLALSFRLIYLAQVSKTPFYYPLVLDHEAYEKKAKEILSTKNFLTRDVFYQTPAYPYFLAFLHKLFGETLFPIRFIQILLGSFISVLIYLISRNYFSVSTSLIASFISAFYGPLLYEDALGDKTTLAVFYFTLATLSSIKANKTKYGNFISGFLWGISSLLRENSLLVGVVLSFVYGRKKFWQSLFGIFIAILPVTLLNLRNGDFVLITSGGGQNFFIGNSSYSTGSYVAPPFVRATPEFEELDFKKEAEIRVKKTLKPRESSNFWYNEGLRFILHNPKKVLLLYIKKTLLLLNSYEIPDNYNYEFLKIYVPILRFPLFEFSLIGPLSLCGLFFSLKNKKSMSQQVVSRDMILYNIIFLYAFSLILFFVVGRYRTPLIPLLLPFSAFTITHIYDYIKQKSLSLQVVSKEWKKFALIFSVILFSYFLVNHRKKDYPISKDFSREHYMLGNAYRKAGSLKDAIKEWEFALSEKPDYKEAMNNLILAKKILSEENMAKDSFTLDELEKAVEINPDNNADAWARLGLFYATRKGDMLKAKEALSKAVSIDSLNSTYWINLGNCYYELGIKKDALSSWKKALSLDPKNEILLKNITALQNEINK